MLGRDMSTDREPLPSDLVTAHAMILAERAARLEAEARARNAEAEVSGVRLEIERLRLLLARMRRERFGQSSERGARLIEQLELQLAELEEGVAEEEAAAEIGAPTPERTERSSHTRKPARRPLPENLPRERIVYPAPCTCPKCGGPVRKLGEDVTETLECEPRRWKVVEHVREKVSCRSCEAISQPPAPSHPIARGRAGPHLLALVLAAKYGQHLPLTRQSAIYAREGVEIDVSTLADWVGAAAASSDAAGRGGPGARLRGRAAARRRHHRAGAGQGADQDRPTVGAMSATTAPSPGPLHLQRRSSTRPIARATIPSATWPGSRASCKRTPMAGSTGSTSPAVSRGRSSRPPVGPMPEESCTSWPRPRRRRSRPRRCGASIGCSRSSATSPA